MQALIGTEAVRYDTKLSIQGALRCYSAVDIGRIGIIQSLLYDAFLWDNFVFIGHSKEQELPSSDGIEWEQLLPPSAGCALRNLRYKCTVTKNMEQV